MLYSMDCVLQEKIMQCMVRNSGFIRLRLVSAFYILPVFEISRWFYADMQYTLERLSRNLRYKNKKNSLSIGVEGAVERVIAVNAKRHDLVLCFKYYMMSENV